MSDLLKLSTKQVGTRWDQIKFAINKSLPPLVEGGDIRMENILDALLKDKMHCWVMEADSKIAAVATTTFMVDPGTKQISLFIYSIFSLHALDINEWQAGFQTLGKWARAMGCLNIVGFTNVSRVVDIVKSLGGSANQMLISIPIGGNGEDI